MGEEPQPSHTFEALVTHVVDKDKFWVQPIYNTEDRKRLAIIESALGSTSKPLTKPLNQDDYVAVKLNERGWRRARLKQHVQHSLAYVQFIDYGNEEQVPETSVYQLSVELGTDVLQEQAVMCALAGVKTPPNIHPQATLYLADILAKRKVTVKAYSISPSAALLVDLVTPELRSVRQTLLLHQIGTPCNIPSAPATVDPGTLKVPKPGPERHAIIVSHINDLTDFYIQFRKAEKNITTMMTAMKSMYTANLHAPATLINIGMICCVQLGSDWFRAEIKQVLSTGFILVMLKDFGNCQQVTPKQIYPLEGSLTNTPFWAVRCGLNNIAPVNPTLTGRFVKQLIQWFERYMADTNAYYTAQFIRKADDRHYIEMFDEPQPGGDPKPSTIELLIQNDCAKRITLPAVYNNNNNNSSGGGGGMQQQLNQMGADMMGTLGQQNPSAYSNMLSTGAMGMANGHNNLSSSHAASMQPTHNNMQSTHSSMQSTHTGLQSSHANMQSSHANMQSMHANMQSSHPSLTSTGGSGFSAYPGSMASSLAAQSPANNFVSTNTASYMTALQQQQMQAAASLGTYSQQQATAPQYQQTSQTRVPRARATAESKIPSDIYEGAYQEPKMDPMMEVSVEIATDPLNFTCLLSKFFDDVDTINADMMAVFGSGRDYSIPSSRVKVGMACVAPFMENNEICYYRAQVTAIHRNEASVLFVDYGNTENIPMVDLKFLPKSCSTVPVSFINCAFDNVAPVEGKNWGDGALLAFEDYFKSSINHQCYFKGKNKDGSHRVELYSASTGLDQPISEELERRGVLRRLNLPDPRNNSAASRGRRPHHRSEADPVRGASQRHRSETPPERTSRGRENTRGREDTRGRENTHHRRSSSPHSSEANSELIRAGFRPPAIDRKGYVDVRIYQPSTPSKFSCQIVTRKDELDELLEKMQKFYDSAAGDDMLLDDLLTFTGCAVLVNGRWARGYILSASYHGCQVLLVDTQEVVSVEADQLRALRSDFLKLPAQGVKCGLDCITPKGSKAWNSEACRFFREHEDSDLIAEFRGEKNGVHQIFLRSSEGGMDQMINALFVVKGWASSNDTSVKQAVEDAVTASKNVFSMYKVQIGKSFTVVPCHVNGPGDFYLHLAQEQQSIEDLQDKINDYYSNNVVDKAKFVVDEYCVGLWEEGWYRAKISTVSRDICELYFLDFGNVDIVPNREVKALTKQFRQQPMYAIRCSLDGVDASQMEQMKDIFQELVDAETENEFHATFIRQEKGSYLVSLYDGNVPLVQKMFQLFYSGGASAKTPSPKQRAAAPASSTLRAGPPCVTIQDRELVQISHANSPTLLYLHSESNKESLEKINNVMNNLYSKSQTLLRIKQVGELCAAQYSEDQCWYRALIEALHGGMVQVRFIDYGNEESKRPNEVFELERQLVDLPAQATPCCLVGIAEPPQGWADAQRELNICDSMDFTVKVADPDSLPLRVELWSAEHGDNLVSQLIQNGYGIDPSRPSIPMPQVPSIDGGTFQAIVCFASHPGRMYIRKVTENDQLEELMTKLDTEYKEQKNLQRIRGDPKIGAVCCAMYNDDEMYYRASIYGITRSEIKIQFVDFGNCEDKMISELYQLSPEYLQLPAQAIECALQGCDVKSSAWTQSMQEYLENLVHENVYNCQILARNQDAYVVTLKNMTSGNSLADDINRFVSSGGASAQSFNSFGAPPSSAPAAVEPAAAPAPAKTDEAVKIDWPPRVDKFEHVPATISWGEGPEEFWINLEDSDGKLLQVQDQMQKVYVNGGRPVPRVFRYMYLAAKSPEYGDVFRAKTLNNDRDMPLVTYVDYGNEEEVPRDNLFVLEEYLAKIIPCQAIRCALDGVDRLKPEGELREELKAKFEELLADKSIMVKNISPAQREKPHNEIEILLENESVIDLLEKELIALSGPPDVPLCTATIGTVIKGGLVSVTSPTDFWVQMAGPIARISESTKACTDRMKEAPEVGTYCAAVLEDDDTVYRARAEKVEGDQITVRCIDYGYQRTLPLKNIYKLKQKCGDQAAQAFPCTLPLTLAEGREAEATALLHELAAKCMTVKIYSKEEDRFTVDFEPKDHEVLFVEPGLATSTLPSLADAAGVYKWSECDADSTYFISHINDLAEFYLQKSDLDIDGLTASVEAGCAGSITPVAAPTRGTPCVAKDTTFHAWNRALVTDILEGDMVKLLYVDYGSTETVKKSTVKELPAVLHDTPVAAIRCSLSPLPEDYSQFTGLFKTITGNDREVSVVPAENGGVSVVVDGLSLTEVFAKATHYSTLAYKQHELEDTCEIFCTSVEDPFNIWVQIASYAEQLEAVMAALSEYCPTAPTLYSTAPGTVCVALFPEDSQWYRAEITKQGTDKCTVKFVDYGNSCEVEKDKLKLLPEEHLEMPANCLLVRLAHVRPQSGSTWADAAIDKLFELTEEKLCEMKCTSVRALQHVTLSVEGADVATAMGDVATLTPDPEVLSIPKLEYAGGDTTLLVSHVEQVDLLYGQLEESAATLEELGAVTPDSLITVDQAFLPLQCWARWEGGLYRANVLSIGQTHAEVWFVDYGNKDRIPISDLWYLKPEHVTLPGQAIPLKVDGVKPVIGGEWTSAAKTVLDALVTEQVISVTLPALTEVDVTSDPTTLHMTIGEVSVGEHLKNNRVARSLIQPPVVTCYLNHQFEPDTPVFCTEVIGDEEATVTCQMGEKLDTIQEQLQAAITVGHPDYIPEEIDPGMPCTCKFTDDGTWYRAEVTDVQGDSVSVTFVDYGNSQTSKKADIQLLPEQFNTPKQMFSIKLDGSRALKKIERNFLPKMMIKEEELLMTLTDDDTFAKFDFATFSEDGTLLTRQSVLEATKEHCAAVGEYPNFTELEVGSVAYSCHIETPNEFYLQQDGCEEVLESIGAQMEAHTDKVVVPAPFIGQPVLAVFEGALYRAVVTEVMSPKSRVRFVDYGNSSVVNEVYEITPAEVVTVPQAIRCSLSNVEAKPGSTAEKLKAAFSGLISEKELSIVAFQLPLLPAPVYKAAEVHLTSTDGTPVAMPEDPAAFIEQIQPMIQQRLQEMSLADQESRPAGVLDTVTVSISVEGANVMMTLLQQDVIADQDATLGEYEKIQIPEDRAVEVIVTHVENEKLFFANRTGGEKEEKDEDDTTPDISDDLVDAETYVTEMQAVLEDTVPPVLEEVAAGALCVTRWEGALYRAVVLWVQHDYAKVRFIDYGNTWHTALSELLVCPEPYRGAPGFAVPFNGQLNQTSPVICDTEYLIERREETEETAGMPVNVQTPKPKLFKYKYTKPEMDTQLTAFVSVPLSHGQFYVQTEAGGETLNELTPLIEAAVKAAVPVPHVVENAPVLGLFDGAYYRGRVVEVTPQGAAKVLFVDYGNTEVCTKMLNVTPELMAVRVVGINCQLEGVEWVGVEAKPAFDEHIKVDEELTLTPVSYCSEKKQFAVKVAGEGGLDINATVASSNISDKSLVETKRQFTPNTFLPLYCSKFISPTDLCLQQEEDVPILDTISAETTASPKINLLSATVGTVCLAKDPKDGEYYRARVLSVSEDNNFTMRYVDYGNRETLPLSALYDIPVALTQHKICGVQCKLIGCVETEEAVSALPQLQALCSPETELCVSLQEEVDGVFPVCIVSGKKCLLELLPTETIEAGQYSYPRFTEKQELFVCVANSPTDFYAQREKDEAPLVMLAELVAKTNKEAVLAEPAPGTPCVALSAEDEMYRAVVISVAEETAVVRYVDYGNTEEVPLSSLFVISPVLTAVPILAVPLSLHAIEEQEWSEECLTAFGEIIYEDAWVTVTPTTWTDANKCEGVVGWENGPCLKSALAAHITNTDAEWVPAEIPVEPIVELPKLTYQKLDSGASTLYVSVANSPDDFYLQKDEWAGELEKLQAQIDASPQNVLENPTVGSPCLAFSPELEGLYRAEILGVSDAGVLVRYVDYGNQETVPAEKVYALTAELLAIPVYAVPCSVASTTTLPVADGVWKEAALTKFSEMVAADAEVVISPVSWNEDDGRAVCFCTLEVEGADVVQAIIQAAQ